MTRSIFDPTGGNTERDGSMFTGPDADQNSNLSEASKNLPTDEPSVDVGFQPPPEKPAINVTTENDGKLLVIQMTGKLNKKDYQHFVPMIEKAVQKHGKVRMLVQMHNFHGWNAGALWEDVKFDLKHFNDIERLAMVGEKKWQKWMATFCNPFTAATVRYFSFEQASEARAWIAAA